MILRDRTGEAEQLPFGLAETCEAATLKGIGTGKMEVGVVYYAGAVTFNTTSSKLASLNAVAGAFEFRVGVDGTTSFETWEWKTGSAAATG